MTTYGQVKIGDKLDNRTVTAITRNTDGTVQLALHDSESRRYATVYSNHNPNQIVHRAAVVLRRNGQVVR